MLQIQTRVFGPAQQPSTVRPSSQRFGCRLAGAMSATASRDGDQFVKHMTDSLPEIANGQRALTEGVHPAAALLGNDQSHGWGYAHFAIPQKPGQGQTLIEFKSPQSVLSDPQFLSHKSSLQSERLSSGIVHVRKATGGTRLTPENTHPFILERDNTQWTFVHNGRWENALSAKVKANLHQDPAFTPKGDTDSEHAFLALMQSVRSQLGTVNARVSGQDKLIRAFAEGIRQLTRDAGPFAAVNIKQPALNIHGKIQVGPSYNFVANDGNLMIAYRHGQSLFLGVKQDAQGKPVGHAVATAPQNTPETVWFDVPENTLVIITREKATGQSQAELRPLESVPPL